jgi:hypothetical protein
VLEAPCSHLPYRYIICAQVSFLSFTAAVCRGCGEFLTMSPLQKDDAPLHAEAEREKMADLGVVF